MSLNSATRILMPDFPARSRCVLNCISPHRTFEIRSVKVDELETLLLVVIERLVNIVLKYKKQSRNESIETL